MWPEIFSNKLDDEQLTGKLWNTIKLALGAEGNLEYFIASNILENNVGRI
jgi:hypothetical protein